MEEESHKTLCEGHRRVDALQRTGLLTNFLTVVVFLSPAGGFKINHN